ncbi:hypothetical protein MNBD_IGNAVI01-515 [hydrothermal vent metagenome]|uniref:Secretion system C-terminal sorting domain-containing protein n=1 Tax=hydrothermal vent metagenome TaxID=652676 RepID=A0A3B1CB22_9ZZZZ
MKKLLTLLMVFGLATIFNAQGMHDGDMDGGGMHDGWANDDTLTTVSVSGTAIVDSSMMSPMYYIDEDGDGAADYHLSFGPYWYQPDSSSAVRPSNGDMITIIGGVENDNNMNLNTIIVYEIDGEFWRDPMIPSWNNMGGHSHMGGHHGDNCKGFTSEWDNDGTMVDTALDGTVYVDTTYFMDEFYLDTDNDQVPDYMLNFGPPWYIPASGAVRPNDGDAISIKGKLMSDNMFPMVVVYELNGVEWRDSSKMGNQFGGRWFHKDMTSPEKIHSPFDNEDYMKVNPGWHNNGGMGGMGDMGGMMNYDSLYAQMLEVFPQNMPYTGDENVFAGYEIGMFTPNGNNGMWEEDDECGGMMNFGSDIDFQLHYNDIQVQGYGIDENTIMVKYWDSQNNKWEVVDNATLDKTTNTVSFSSSSASASVILTAQPSSATNVNGDSKTVVNDFKLNQNYPNPFNPSTTIEFSINEANPVELNIYNALGQKITTLVNRALQAGSYQYQFDASNLASGVYFYELKVGTQNTVKKMNLMK